MEMTKVGRLAMRVEGEFWNAYWAPEQTTMQGAVHLGSIRMTLIKDDRAIKDEFLKLMQSSVAAAVRSVIGGVPSWSEPETAPEHERVGHS